MKSRYQQQLKSTYQSPILCFDDYNKLFANQAKTLEVQNNAGFLRFLILDAETKNPIPYATITAYVTDGTQRDIPIMHLVTTINPVRIELPIAHDLGMKIRGPEYEFSTYNVSIDIFGYFTQVVYDIRLFPNTTADFTVEMVPITQIQMQPVIEKRVEIPPHPRDVVNGQPE